MFEMNRLAGAKLSDIDLRVQSFIFLTKTLKSIIESDPFMQDKVEFLEYEPGDQWKSQFMLSYPEKKQGCFLLAKELGRKMRWGSWVKRNLNASMLYGKKLFTLGLRRKRKKKWKI